MSLHSYNVEEKKKKQIEIEVSKANCEIQPIFPDILGELSDLCKKRVRNLGHGWITIIC